MKVREVLVHKPGFEISVVEKPGRWQFSDIPKLGYMQMEHDELVRALQNEGVKVNYLLKPVEKRPKSYLIMDDAIVLDRKAITCHLASFIRRGEEQLVKLRLKELGIKIAGHIFVPGVLQGSDIFFIDKSNAVVCVENTSNDVGAEHFTKIMNIKTTSLNLEGQSSTQLNIINDIAIISEDLAYGDAYNFFKENGFDIVLVQKGIAQGMGLGFLQVDDQKIINIKSEINKKLKMLGYDVIELEIKELLKGNCGIRNICLPFY